LGQTAVSGELTHLLGRIGVFDDLSRTAAGVPNVLTGLPIKARWVKNNSGGALLPGEIVTCQAGYQGQYVDAKCGAAGVGAGVVDPYLPSAGVADGYHFWMVIEGPVSVLHAGNDAIGSGDLLVTAASGRVDKYDGTATAATEPNSLFGRSMENPADTAGTSVRALVKFPGF
jgi:hypothetical protein